CGGAEVHTICSNIDALSISSRNATFSFRSHCSVCLRSSMLVAATYQRVRRPWSSRIGFNRCAHQCIYQFLQNDLARTWLRDFEHSHPRAGDIPG
ncbi:MAG: hypothetical protein JWO80_5726, partial [Bryobacterales bacterium]|nr:hypothetical protein [Bryobacterales bacterium]